VASNSAASLAALLKQHRAVRGLTQEELAERASLSARAISDLERGIAHRPQAYTIGRLVDALGLSAADAAQFERAARRLGGRGDEQPTRPTTLPIQPTPLIGTCGS
jgi:transcriptional regulator with XRE-family HTH domain